MISSGSLAISVFCLILGYYHNSGLYLAAGAALIVYVIFDFVDRLVEFRLLEKYGHQVLGRIETDVELEEEDEELL